MDRKGIPALLVTLCVAGTVAAFAAAKGTPGESPAWLEAGETHAIAASFPGAHLTSVSVSPEPTVVDVVFEFQDVVTCRECARTGAGKAPRGRVVRVSFSRRTHRVSGAMKLCDPAGIPEPLARCLAG